MANRDGKCSVTVPVPVDHQQIAYELYGIWATAKTGDRIVMKRILAMPTVDALVVMVRFMDLADELAGSNLLHMLERRSARMHAANKEAS